MLRIQIKIGQIWENNRNKAQFLIVGKKNDKFLTKVLTDKPDFYSATHKMARNTLWSKFKLIK